MVKTTKKARFKFKILNLFNIMAKKNRIIKPIYCIGKSLML